MNVVGAHDDLRYLLGNYRLFITSRATSTVSWLVASGKPLVFINHFCHARLSEQAIEAFSEAFFLFDQSEDDFTIKLTNFLNRAFFEIEREWEAKSSIRSKIIESFFSGKLANRQNHFLKEIRKSCISNFSRETSV